jgi:CelD/BcsL family acetyltransferase involved in cellulose biosynthesis
MAAINGWLRLGFLYFNDVPIACQFWISTDSYAYIVKLFYDENYQQYAPGKILSAHMAKHVIDVDRVQTIDYLHGDEPYKKDWTPKRRERRGITVYNNNSKGQYLALLNNKILPVFNKYTLLKRAKEIVARRVC